MVASQIPQNFALWKIFVCLRLSGEWFASAPPGSGVSVRRVNSGGAGPASLPWACLSTSLWLLRMVSPLWQLPSQTYLERAPGAGRGRRVAGILKGGERDTGTDKWHRNHTVSLWPPSVYQGTCPLWFMGRKTDLPVDGHLSFIVLLSGEHLGWV